MLEVVLNWKKILDTKLKYVKLIEMKLDTKLWPKLSYFKEKWYVYNIFTTFLQQILSGRLLIVVIIRIKK